MASAHVIKWSATTIKHKIPPPASDTGHVYEVSHFVALHGWLCTSLGSSAAPAFLLWIWIFVTLDRLTESFYDPHFLIRDAKIAASERVKSGVTGEQLWLKINEPTEKDKGKYTMDIFDGKDGVKRVFDLTGKGEWKLESQKEKDFKDEKVVSH